MQTPRERHLATLEAVAADGERLITRQAALSAGVPNATLTRLANDGLLERVGVGAYVRAGDVLVRRQQFHAALTLIGGEAVLCRRSAAEVHGLPVAPDRRTHVLVRDRSWHGTRPIAVHRTTKWRDDHIVEVDELATTTVTRTLVDLAVELSRFQLSSALKHAIRHRTTSVSDLRRCLDIVGRVRGAAILRELLDEVSPLEADTASALESIFLELATKHGLAPSALNYPVIDADGRQRYIDAVYLPERVPVELDGEAFHTSPADRAADREREHAILATGQWRPFLRFTFEDVTDRTQHVVRTLRDALEQARRSPVPKRRAWELAR